MSLLTPELLRELVAEARLAPSVHNIQPTRWQMLADGQLALVDDTTVRAPVADPTGHDVRLSHGAALEGMSLALNRRGLSIVDIANEEQPSSSPHVVLCRLMIGNGAASVSLLESVLRRMSWRSTFAASSQDEESLAQLAASCSDIVCIRDRKQVADIATWADEAELSFTRSADFRRELLTWMRLSPSDPLYLQSGLNREALAMSAIEASGARLVLGPLFPVLDKLGLAAPLLSDRAKTQSAAAIVLFCRPRGEDPLESGRHFYRAWLEIDRAGLVACPMSALADFPATNDRLRAMAGLDAELRLVNVFRVGHPTASRLPRHFRLPVDPLIL
jgi:nitroreductase